MTHFKGIIIIDDNDNAAEVDSIAGGLVVLDSTQNTIHDGIHFFYNQSATVGNGNTFEFMLTTPDDASRIHYTVEITFTAVTAFTIWEAGDRTGTNVKTPFNNDRNSSNAAVLVIHEGTSGGSTDGTQLDDFIGGLAAGSSSRAGGSLRDEDELGLKQNTKYIIRAASSTSGNLISFRHKWYEKSVPEP